MLDHVGPGEPERDDPEARWKGTCRWLLFGVRREAPPSFRGLYEAPDDPDRTGVCCSGGGIRSAAFNLGALQELQARKVLQTARYLSAVSRPGRRRSSTCATTSPISRRTARQRSISGCAWSPACSSMSCSSGCPS
jgi:hypothetical protein